MSTAEILFLQGGGKGAHKVDAQLVTGLQHLLGERYLVVFPKVPGEDDPHYKTDEAVLAAALGGMDRDVLLVGHSLGACFLLKFLSEHQVSAAVSGIFLLSAPFWGKGGWQYEGFTLDNARAAVATGGIPVFFYHGTEDETVPFSHLGLYKAAYPHAFFREVAGGDHQLGNDMSLVAADILGLDMRGHPGNA